LNRPSTIKATAIFAASLALMAVLSLATRKHDTFTPQELKVYQMRVEEMEDPEPPPLTEAEFAEFQAALRSGDQKQLDAIVEKLGKSGDEAVAQRKRRHRTDEEQERRDHLKAERAKRWGIFLHYAGMGIGTTTGSLGLLGWGFGFISSMFGFAYIVGRDAVILMIIAAIVIICGMVFVAYKLIRWLLSFFWKGKSNVDA
jgi:hypothetical protein